jgi:hypothetical protein
MQAVLALIPHQPRISTKVIVWYSQHPCASMGMSTHAMGNIVVVAASWWQDFYGVMGVTQ